MDRLRTKARSFIDAASLAWLAGALVAPLSGCMTLPSAPTVGNDALVGASLLCSSNKPAIVDVSQYDKARAADNQVQNTAKPAAPRTLPEAICAYLRSLHEPLPEAKNGDHGPVAEPPKKENGKATENQANEKNAPKNGEETKKDEIKGDKENGGEKDKDEAAKNAWFSAHAQATMDWQFHGPFHAPYTGALSLLPVDEAPVSVTSTLFLDARLWECDCYSGDLVFNPELSGGRGFSGVNGIAGFTNGDITRVGVAEPTPYIARLFLRQSWGLGGEQEKVEDAANQIAGQRDIDRVTLMAGKMAATDLIDNNTYSHDPRTQFQNWSLMYNGAWDYPANVRGYDYGVGIELNQKDWAVRYGIWGEPAFANGAPIDPHIAKAFGQAVELECRWTIDQHPGKVRLMAYLNRAHMGDYAEALAAMPVDPDVTQTQAYRFKYGFGGNFEQEVTRDLGIWGRLGWSDGHTESWAFTEIDRTAGLGLLLKGRCWNRPNDDVGLGGVVNGLARDHRNYLAAGGLDFSIGDGQLNYGLEQIIEAYYRVAITKQMFVTADFQEVWNPAYNRDRGPVWVLAMMVHFEI